MRSAAAGEAPRDERRGLTRGDLIAIGVVFVLALVLRLVYVGQLARSPMFDAPTMDEQYHDQWARAIVRGERFIDAAYFRAPLYPGFLAAVYKLIGPSYRAPRIAQAVLGAIGCVLVYLVGRAAFDRRVALIAALVASTYWMLIYYDGELLIPTLIVPLDLLLLLLLVLSARRPGLWLPGAAGVVMGLSAIARPNILLFAPAAALWLIWLARPVWRQGLLRAACLTLGTLLPILPITLRNWVVGRDLVLISTQGGVNFYIGNNPQSNGVLAVVPGTPGDWWGGYHATIARAEQAAGRKLRGSEVSRYYFREAARFWAEQPRRALALTLHKLRLFWTRAELPNNKDMYFWIEQFTPLLGYLPVGFGLVGTLGLVGLILCRRRAAELFPLWGFVLVYMASIVLFFCNARYRLPVVPVLILLGAYAVVRACDAARARQWGFVAALAAGALPAALWVNVAPPLDELRRANLHLEYTVLGSLYEKRGKTDLARAAYESAVRARPDFLKGQLVLGSLLANENDIAAATDHFRAALRATPRLEWDETDKTVALVHSQLATALLVMANYDEAAEHFARAVALDATDAEGYNHYNLAVLHETQGRPDAAAAAYRSALERNPLHQQARTNLIDLLLDRGEYAEAETLLRELVATAREHPDTQYLSGRFLSAAGRYGEAVDALSRSVRGRPDNVRAWHALCAALAAAGRPAEALEVGRRALELAQISEGPGAAELAKRIAVDVAAIEEYLRSTAVGDGASESQPDE